MFNYISVAHLAQPQRSAVVHPEQLRQRAARLELAPRPMRHRPAANEAGHGRRTGKSTTRTRKTLLTRGHGPPRTFEVRLLLMPKAGDDFRGAAA